jgi:phosphate starvation-inducible PhoH-like protein
LGGYARELKKVIVPQKGIEALFGPQDETLRYLEDVLHVQVDVRGNDLIIHGEEQDVEMVERIFDDYATLLKAGHQPSGGDLKRVFQQIAEDRSYSLRDHFVEGSFNPAGKKRVIARSPNQLKYIQSIREHDIVFAIGVGGTGKTYLAVAVAVQALMAKEVNRIILTRPAVEAGERLGFLPGDLQEKVDPYLRPLYDALYDIMDFERVERLLERRVIEVAPLAFMRGRTLSSSFIILDEAQNTTTEQMKMFLTRLGFDSKAVITGDVTQIDLPPGRKSGLVEARQFLSDIDGIDFVYFNEKDVVRHHLVRLIIKAYEERAKQEPPA